MKRIDLLVRSKIYSNSLKNILQSLLGYGLGSAIEPEAFHGA